MGWGLLMLRLHDNGPEVKVLQEGLVRAGMNVQMSSHFGYGTLHAVQAFQLANHLVPDGNVGPVTMKALGMEPAAEKHPARLVQPATVSSPKQLAHQIGECLCSPAMVASAAKASPPLPMAHMPSFMTTSDKGKDFITSVEVPKSQFYWPGGKSGVTIGAGFDLKHRHQHDVANVFKAVLPSAEHHKIPAIVEATKVAGTAAGTWAKKHQDLVDLDETQIRKLLNHAVKEKEKMVKHDLHYAMYQHQFDALVSFAYNSGGKWHTVTRLINHGKVREAMVAIGAAVTSGRIMAGLLDRRKKEIGLYLYGKYEG
jgi:GH24 family phage-related lysozyme (muramidase)